MRRSLAIAAVLVALAPPSSSRADHDTERAQIKTVTDQLYGALMKGDSAVLEHLLAEDFVGIHGNGSIQTKPEYLASTRSGAFTYRKYDVRDSRIRVYGDAAVVDALITFSGNAGGRSFTDVDIRVTRIWVRQQGDWKCVEYQVTRVLSPKAGS